MYVQNCTYIYGGWKSYEILATKFVSVSSLRYLCQPFSPQMKALRSYLSTIPTCDSHFNSHLNSHFLLSRSGNSFLKIPTSQKRINRKWEFKWDL